MTRLLYKTNDKWTEIEVDDVVVLGNQLMTDYLKVMHPKQKAILELSKLEDITKMTLRAIGLLSGIGDKPQVVKHHLEQLKKKGFLNSLSSPEGV